MDTTLIKRSQTESTLPEIHEEDIPALRTMMSTIRRNPMPALKELLTRKPSKTLLLAIVNLCLIESRVRRLGSAQVFIQYIVDGYEDEASTDAEADTTQNAESESVTKSDSKPDLELTKASETTSKFLNAPPELISTSGLRPWETPLRGIINILAGIKREKSQSRLDVRTIDELRAAYKSIMAAIWRDLSHILLPGRGGDLRRSLIGRALCLFANLPGMKQNMHDEPTLSLVMHCWLYMSSCFEYRQCALFAVQALFQNPRDTPPGLKELAVQTVTAKVLCERFVDILRQGKLVDRALEEEIWAFFQFATTPYPFALTFTHAEVYNDISRALTYQLHFGTEQWTSDIFNISYQIIHHMIIITPPAEKMSRFTHMIQSSILEITAAGIVIADRRGLEDWFGFLSRIMHTLSSSTCTDTDCAYVDTPEFRTATYRSFEPLYLPFRSVLRDADKIKPSVALVLWEELAALLGVTEAKIKERRRQNRQCGEVHCQNRGDDVKTLACVRCQSIYYCGKACQRRDWKNHKPHCVKPSQPAIGEDEAAS